MNSNDFAERVWWHLTGQADAELAAEQAEFCKRFSASYSHIPARQLKTTDALMSHYYADLPERHLQGSGILIVEGNKTPEMSEIKRIFPPGLVILLTETGDD